MPEHQCNDNQYGLHDYQNWNFLLLGHAGSLVLGRGHLGLY